MKQRSLLPVVLVLSSLGMVVGGCAGTASQESTGQFIDSSVITTRVKTKLFQDPITKGFDISVATFKDEVQLSGYVDSQAQKERAELLARSVPGVRSVKNDLMVK